MRLLDLFAATAMAAAAGFAGAAMAQAPGESLTVGDWTVSNSRNKDGSQTCAALIQFEDKSTFGITADTGGTFTFLFIEPTAKLTPQTVYDVSFAVDGNAPIGGQSAAVDEKTLVVIVTDPDTVFKQLADGNNVTINVAGQAVTEPLVGSARAIGQLGQCFSTASGK